MHGRVGLDQSRNDEPQPKKRVIPIKRVGATEVLQTIILSDHVEGYDTHWVGDHTQPCLRKGQNCPLCDRECPRKWLGYLHCWEEGNGPGFFLELTELAYERLQAIKGERPSLRGLIVVFSRERRTMKSPVQVVRLGEKPAGKALPMMKSVSFTLEVTWKKWI